MGMTSDQKFAIEYDGGAAIVSAAAGSGKTSVLVERVKRIILDRGNGINADDIVVVTFTNEAAAELKARIDKALDDELTSMAERSRASGLTPEEKKKLEYLNDQRLRLADAHISTISSFCLELLRRNSAEAGLQPGFSVIDESEQKLMYARAMRTVLEDLCANGSPDERDLLYTWFFGENDDALQDAITKLYDFSRDLPDRDTFFKEQTALYSDPDDPPPHVQAQLDAYVRRNITANFAGALALLPKLTTLATGTGADKVPGKWEESLNAAKGVTDLKTCIELYDKVTSYKAPALRGKKNEELDDELKSTSSAMQKMWNDAVACMKLIKRRSPDMTLCRPVLEALIKQMKNVERVFGQMKRERGVVDFQDIELMAIDMLRDPNGDPTELAKEIAASIKVIIVDEFQDSNDIQYEIFRLISDNKKNLFFVGDVKQSIYRFRGADPTVFTRLTEDPDFKVIELRENFRSCKEVIDSVNMIFTGTMTKELGDVDYNDSCALRLGSTYYNTDSELNKTELVIFRNEEQSKNDLRSTEADYIAWRIKDMTDSGFRVTERSGDTRPCGYGDFAVIMGRYRSSIDIYKQAFDKAGLPYEANESEDYTGYSEVKLAMSLLKVIDDPYRSADLAAVLMTEPFMFSAQEMAEIKLAGGSSNKYLWLGLLKYAETHERAAAAVREINDHRAFAAENSAERLIRRICDESMLVPAIQSSPSGAKRGFNLHKLIYYAEVFSNGSCIGLGDFIASMDALSAGKVRLPQAKGASKSGAVRLMTIHGSKGLEFPICFVSNLFSRPIPLKGDIQCDNKYGIGMKINSFDKAAKLKTATFTTVSDEIKRRNDSESMRLLYVAATRAKEKLIFTAPDDGSEPGQHFGWVFAAAKAPGADKLIKIIPVKDNIYSRTASACDTSAKAAPKPLYRPYPYPDVSKAPAKVTATQIGVKSVDDFSSESSVMDRFLRLPTFTDKPKEKSRLSGKEAGTAYHKVMERLDFSMDPKDIPMMLDKLLEDGVLTDAERVNISCDEIGAFLASDLCRRAAASKRMEREYPIFCEYTPAPGEWNVADWTDEEKPYIQGIADMFFVENDEIVLVDYKTNRNTSMKELTEEYEGQLAIYAHALSEATGMKVKQKLLYSFELGAIEIE